MKKPVSYLVNGVLASAVLCLAFSLSASGRTAIDWVVIGLVGLAIVWNLVHLGRRLYLSGGGRDLWHLQRTVLLWVVGLLNTALIRPQHVGSWRNVVGWALVALAATDTIWLYRKERGATSAPVDQPTA